MDKLGAHTEVHHDLDIEGIIILLLIIYYAIPNGSYMEMRFLKLSLEIAKL
jgi:hypothetical protein